MAHYISETQIGLITPYFVLPVNHVQFDQMGKIILHLHLAIYDNVNLPNCINNFKLGSILNNPHFKIAQRLKKLAKVAKFRQIWSHWKEANIQREIVTVYHGVYLERKGKW